MREFSADCLLVQQMAASTGVTDQAARTLNRLNRLPAFNETAIRLLARPFGESDSLSDIEASFRGDPGLAAQLLTAANSPMFGFRAQISTIRHALAVLGMERIRTLVATIATSSYMRQFPIDAVRPIWSHAIATAVIAESLAGYSDGLSGSAVYTAGLTHDMGRLGLLAGDRQRYESYLHSEFKDRNESDRSEWENFGIIHTVAGGLLTQLWGFPAMLCSLAESHHDASAFDTEEDRVVHNACLLADALGYPEVQLRSATVPDGIGWAENCRGRIEQDIQQFLG